MWSPVSNFNALSYRRCLQSEGVLDLSLCLVKDSDETVLLPILSSSLPQLDLQSLKTMLASDTACEIVWSEVIKAFTSVHHKQPESLFLMYLMLSDLLLPQSPLQSKKERGRTHSNKLEKILQDLLEVHGEGWTEELRRDLPRSFQKHGDLVLLGDSCFSQPQWKKIGTIVKCF